MPVIASIHETPPTCAYPGGGSDFRDRQAAGLCTHGLSEKAADGELTAVVNTAPKREVFWPVVTFVVRVTRTASAKQLAHGTDEVFVGGMRVDARRQDRLVPGESLRQPDVLGAAVDGRARRMPQ